MDVDVLMPVITASGEEAVVTAWFVDEGGHCATGQLIAEVQAEKVSADVEATAAGRVVQRVEVNQPVPQGNPICRITDSAEGPSHVPPPAAPAALEPTVAGKPVAASPAAKRLARELGVDLTDVVGSGPGGRITESDVRQATTVAPVGGGLRAVIARNMRRSHAETAAVTLHHTVDFGSDVPTRVTASIVKTVAEVLPAHPHMNGYRHGDVFEAADVAQVAVAIQTDEGLVAPVIRDAARRSLEEVDADIRRLADLATARELSAEHFEGGTFTVTNLGVYGIDGFTPIINLPQVAVLGVGAIRRVPVIDRAGEVTAGHQMVLSLTFDHAFVDGAPAAAFLRDVGVALTR